MLIVPIDKAAIAAVGTVSGILIETDDLQYESILSIENALYLALTEYWADADWTGIEFFLECTKEVDNEMLGGLAKVLIRKLADTVGFPRLTETRYTLGEQMNSYRGTHYLSDATLNKINNTLAVRVEYSARTEERTW